MRAKEERVVRNYTVYSFIIVFLFLTVLFGCKNRKANYSKLTSVKYLVPEKVVADISQRSAKLKTIAASIRKTVGEESDLSELPIEPSWPKDKKPANKTEWKLMIAALKEAIFNRLVKAAFQNDFETMQREALQYQSIGILGMFSFEGVDAKGKPKLTLPGFKEYASLQESKLGPRTAFALVKSELPNAKMRKYKNNKSLLSICEEPELKIQDEDIAAAMLQSKKEQTIYYSELPGEAERKLGIPEKGDPIQNNAIRDPITWWFDFIIGKFNQFEFINDSTKDLHESNLIVIEEVMNEARENPEEFGLQKPPVYMTDIPVAVYLKHIARERALMRAIQGGVLSAGVGVIFAQWIGSARISFTWYGVQAVGFEPVFSAIGAYVGAIQMYVLHRYYSHMMGVRYASQTLERSDYDPNKATIAFNSEDISIGPELKKQIYNSFAVGIAAGFGIKYFFSAKRVMEFMFRISEKALSHNAWKVTGFLGRAVSEIMTTPDMASLLRHFPVLHGPLTALAKVPIVGQFIDRMLLSSVPSAFISILADVVITVGSMYWVMYEKMMATAYLLNNTYISPGINIQMALVDPTNEKCGFKEATREVFYPLCLVMSQAKFARGTLPPEEVLRRKAGCFYMMRELEGVSKREVDNDKTWSELRKQIATPDRFFNQKVDDQIYTTIIAKAQHYPTYYKTVWLAGIKAIYPHSRIPHKYWQLQNDMIYGDRYWASIKLERAFAWYSDNYSNFTNVQRLNYMLDTIALNIHQKRNAGGEEEEVAEQAKHVRSYEAFIAYFKFNHQNAYNNTKQLAKLSEEVKFNGGLLLGIKELWGKALDHISWLVEDMKSSPADTSLSKVMADEIKAMN